MITLHESNITSFPHDNGIGVLKDVIRAYAEEELNGLFEFYMEYDSEGHLVDELKEERIIKAKAQDKLGYQLFRIYSITKNHENDNLIVRAQHITYDLADNFVESLVANNLTKKQVMELIGSSTVLPHPFNVTSSNTTTRSSTKLYRTNPLQMVGGIEGSVLQIWGGQIERDNFNLILHDRRGSDDGVKVTYEKNLTGLEATFDISGLVTRIFPFVYIEETDNEPARLITVSGKYIDSPHINDYEKIYIKPIDYSNDERIDIQDKTDAQIRQQLTNIASKYFEETGNDKIKVDMEVQFEHLWETEEYKDLAVLELVGMGDTVTIEHSRLKVDATAIVNYIRYDCIAEKNEEVRLGSVKARLTDSVNKVVDVAERVEQAQQTANQAIRAANGKNTIYYGPDEPTNGIEGDLWFRVVDGEYTRTYRHDGIQWQLVLSVDVRDAMDEAQQAKDDAQSAVNRANQATQQATNAINQAQTAFDEAQAALSTANNALTQANSAFSLANDAFSEVTALSTIVDENTGEISTIKQSVIGLQTRVSDNEGNISNLTQIAQGLQSQVSDIEGNVSTLTQTAQGLQSSITNLQNELDGLEIGGRNLEPDSHFEGGSRNGWGQTLYFDITVENSIAIFECIQTHGASRLEKVFSDLKVGEVYTLTIFADLPKTIEWRSFINANILSQRYLEASPGKFKTYSVTFEVTGNSEVSDVTVRGYIPNLDIGTKVYMDWYKLEKGNKATDWTPAPEDIDHQFSVITQTIDSITTRVGDAEGNITTLQQTSSSLAARLTSAEGNITTLTATVSGLQTTVSNVQGDVSSVTQLANALQSRMTDAEGNINTLTQTVDATVSRISSLGNPNLITHNPDKWDSQLDIFHGLYVEVEPNTTYTFTDYSTGVVEGLQVNYVPVKRGEPYTFESDSSGVVTIGLIAGNFKERLGTIFRFKLEKGDVATAWTAHDEDVYSQYSQLSDAINLRVQKGDIINQINISDESILIDGKRIHITGQTTIDNGVIKSAHIQSLDAGKITTGTLDAGKISVINLSANSISGGILTSLNSTTRFNLNTGVLNIGSQLELSSRGLETYSGGNRTSLLDGSGQYFYRDNRLIGHIGTAGWENDANYRGLWFGIGFNADYMAWARQALPDTDIYPTLLVWHRTSAKDNKGFTFYDNVKFEYDITFSSRGYVRSFTNAVEWGVRGSNYCITQFDNGQVQFHTGSNSATHAFFPNGTKQGGSIEIEGKRYGMSPIDSPQILIEYIEFDVELSEVGTKVYIDKTFLKATENFAVFPNNGNVVEKGSDYFIVAGSGVADVRIVGKRVGYSRAFWGDMESLPKPEEKSQGNSMIQMTTLQSHKERVKENWFAEQIETRIEKVDGVDRKVIERLGVN